MMDVKRRSQAETTILVLLFFKLLHILSIAERLTIEGRRKADERPTNGRRTTDETAHERTQIFLM